MKRQADIFLAGEADAWLERNRESLGKRDPVCDAIDDLGIKPMRVLEVGCADGWRLTKMREKYGCQAHGIDPGYPPEDRQASRETASSYYFRPDIRFDCIIFGFCLYLVDREDLFTVVANADHYLNDGGHLIIHDFRPPTVPPFAFARKYKHTDGVMSYHMNNAGLWLAHPWYTTVDCFPGAESTDYVHILRKNVAAAFPVHP
jgi:hypothetical protein